MKLLITGASGLLGSKLSEIATQEGFEVYSAYSQHKPSSGTRIKLDVSNRKSTEKTFDKVKPEAVVHAASLTDVDRCESEKKLAWKVNAEGTRNITESCKKHRAFLVYISTDYVFNGKKGLYMENDDPDPVNYYGLTKLKGEEHAKSLLRDHCITRTSVLYGSVPATGKTNFTLWLIEKLKGNEEVKIINDQWNSPTLNTNMADMTLEIVKRRITGTYHLAGATRTSRYDLAQLIAKTFRLNTNLIKPSASKEMPWIATRPRDSSLNIEKARQTLKTKPLTIEQALKKMKKEIPTDKTL